MNKVEDRACIHVCVVALLSQAQVVIFAQAVCNRHNELLRSCSCLCLPMAAQKDKSTCKDCKCALCWKICNARLGSAFNLSCVHHSSHVKAALLYNMIAEHCYTCAYHNRLHCCYILIASLAPRESVHHQAHTSIFARQDCFNCAKTSRKIRRAQ